mmetsp:Transcript_6484/g.25991  ORF Transcript_6484/g.25991 Transcript_6484/m.25991 type:complete len:216 (+) Transcript_6484:760-1407(+)
MHRMVELGFQHRARGAVRRSHARARRAGVLVQHVLFLLLVGVRVVERGVHERWERRRRRENARRGDARGEHGGVVIFVRPRVRDGVLRECGRGIRRVHERQSRRRKARRVGAHAHVVHSHRRRTSRHRGDHSRRRVPRGNHADFDRVVLGHRLTPRRVSRHRSPQARFGRDLDRHNREQRAPFDVEFSDLFYGRVGRAVRHSLARSRGQSVAASR